MLKPQELINKLQTATTGSREIDALLAECFQVAPKFSRTHYPHIAEFLFSAEDNGYIKVLGCIEGHDWDQLHRTRALRYTSLLDDALTLLPETADGYQIETKIGWAKATILWPNSLALTIPLKAHTPALAICLAAVVERTKIKPRPKKVSPRV